MTQIVSHHLFRECKELPQAASLFIPGLSGAVLLNGEVPNTKVLALHCDFGPSIPDGSISCVGVEEV